MGDIVELGNSVIAHQSSGSSPKCPFRLDKLPPFLLAIRPASDKSKQRACEKKRTERVTRANVLSQTFNDRRLECVPTSLSSQLISLRGSFSAHQSLGGLHFRAIRSIRRPQSIFRRKKAKVCKKGDKTLTIARGMPCFGHAK